MKNKNIFKTLSALCAAFMLLCCFSVTAFAQGAEQTEAADATNDSGVQIDPQPLTPEGNMALVDDIEGEAAEDKQFIVVQSKGGNYFYIVIDHAAEGENSVHFLNQVDEADLMAIIEDGRSEAPTTTPAVCSCTDKCEAGKVNTACPVCSVNMTDCTGKEAAAEPEETQQPEKSGAGGLVIFLVVALLGGGGALYYFKVMKPKQGVKGSTDLDDFDFDEYDEDEADEQPATEEDPEDDPEDTL